MKKIVTLIVAIVAAGLWNIVSGQDFDAKLKRFVTITDNKYAPEISRDEAIKLGFTVNDYNRFVDYVGQLNVKTKPALTLPENLFLVSFVECEGDKLVLNISLEKALRAGATAEGYFQTVENLNVMNEMIPAGERKERVAFIRETQQKLMDYARQHPDSSAVKKFFTAPPMPSF